MASEVPAKMTADDIRAITNTAWGCIPHFHSSSIEQTVAFYTEKLHFELGGVHPDDGQPLRMCSVAIGVPAIRGNIYLFLRKPGEAFYPATCMISTLR